METAWFPRAHLNHSLPTSAPWWVGGAWGLGWGAWFFPVRKDPNNNSMVSIGEIAGSMFSLPKPGREKALRTFFQESPTLTVKVVLVGAKPRYPWSDWMMIAGCAPGAA